MNSTKPVVGPRSDQVLEASVHDRIPVVLTLSSPAGWRTCKGTFFDGGQSAGKLRVKVPLQGSDDGGQFVKEGEKVGLTFRSGRHKWMLSTIINETLNRADGVILTTRWPKTVQRLSRRAYQRAEPAKAESIAVRFWTVGGENARPEDGERARNGQLEDLSAGGMRVRVADRVDLPMGHVCRCVFTPRQGVSCVIVDGILRHREAFERGRASLGFQFVGLEMTTEGRRTLDRIVRLTEQFQRSRERSGR